MKLLISDKVSSDIVLGKFDQAIQQSTDYFEHVKLQLSKIQTDSHRYNRDASDIINLNQTIQNINGCLAWIITSDSSEAFQKRHALALLHDFCKLPNPFDPAQMFTPFNSPLFKAVNEARLDSVRLWVTICDVFYEDPDSGQWAIGYIPQQCGGIDDPDREHRQRCFEIVLKQMVNVNPQLVLSVFDSYVLPLGRRLGVF